MGINTKTNEFLENLMNLVQSSGLPVVNVRLCLDVVRGQLIELEKQAIEQEKTQQAEKDDTK